MWILVSKRYLVAKTNGLTPRSGSQLGDTYCSNISAKTIHKKIVKKSHDTATFSSS